MTIRKYHRNFTIGISLLFVFIVIQIVLSSRGRSNLESHQQLQHKAVVLSHELHQSSELLTRMARSYVMTQDSTFLERYYEVLAIRNGKIARSDGRTIPFRALLEELNLTDSEKVLLSQSEDNSNELAQIEIRAFKAVAGELIDDSSNVLTIDNQMAQSLLFSEKYFESKKKIMEPIAAFEMQVQERITSLIDEEESLRLLYFVLFGLALLGIFVWIYIFIIGIRNKVLNPLKSGEEVARIVESGDFHSRWDFPDKGEIGDLAESFNQMLDRINESNDELHAAIENATSLNLKLNSQNEALNASAIVVTTNLKGDITYCNEKFVEISGYSKQEALGQNHRIVNSGFHPISFWKEMYATVGKGGIWRADVRNTAKDGSTYWVDSVIAPIKDEQGEVVEYLGIRFEVTEKKEIEEQLDAQNLALDETAIVSVTDVKGNIIRANDLFSKVSQYSQEEIIGANHRIVNSGYHDKDFWTAMYKNLANGDTWRADVKNKAKDGSFYWVDSIMVPMFYGKKKPQEYMAVRFLITDKKEAEIKLAESEEQFNSIVKNVPGIIFRCLIDEAWTMLFISEQVERISGYPQAYFVNNAKMSYADLIHPDDLQKVQDAVAEKIAIKEQYKVEYRIFKADGSMRWVSSQGQAVFNENDEILWLDGAIVDITEVKESEISNEKNQKTLRSIFETMPVGMVMISPEGVIVEANSISESILGVSANVHKMRMLESEDWRVVREDGTPMPVEEYAASRALAGEELVKDVVMGVNRPDGSLVWINVAAAQIAGSASNGVVVAFEDVTEKRKMLDELKEVNLLSDTALDLTKSGFWHVDFEDLDHVILSDKVENILGLELKNNLMSLEDWGQNLKKADEISAVLNQTEAGKVLSGMAESYEFTYPIYRPKFDDVLWVHSVGHLQRDDAGVPRHVYGVLQDINDQKLAEEEIIKISTLSDNALELTKAGFWYVDFSDEGYFNSSDRATKIFGMENTEDKRYLIDDWFGNVVKGDEKISEHVGEQFSGTIEGKYELYDVEYPFYRPLHDEVIWVHAVGHVVRDEDGKAKEMFGVVQNIHENKMLQQELQSTLDEVEHINFLSDTALDLTKSGFWHIDLVESEFFYAADRVIDIIGMKYDDNQKYKLEAWKENVIKANSEDAKQVQQDLNELIAGNQEVIDNQYQIYRPKFDDLIWVHVIGHLQRDGSGKAVHIYGVLQDITETKLIEKALAGAKADAEAATEAKSSFLANMSHEIRTPMNAIIGFSHLIQKTELDEKQGDYIHKIESSSKSLLGIINDILDFSKIEAGKLNIENADFDLESVFQDLANIITYKAHEKGLEVVFGIDSHVPTYLNGDPLRLGQILTNLSNNAIKFTEHGEVVIAAEVESETDETVVIKFSVKDSGIGIEKDKIPMLFESFTQADTSTSRKFGGTGLGLTISKNLAEMMNGRIRAESEYGHGSIFSFTAELKKQAHSNKGLVPSTDLRGLKVLVVDDSEAARETLREALESFSFKVTTVDSAKNGIQVLKEKTKEPYELVLMDWNMPEMDGLTASEIIMNDKAIPNAPMIMMVTAYGKEDVIQKSEKLGVASLLIKPVRYSLLFDSIMNCFGKTTRRVSNKDLKLTEQSKELDKIRGAEILLAEDNLINQQVATELLEGAGFKITIANNGLEVLDHLEKKNDFDIILMDLQMPEMGGYEATSAIRLMDKFNDLPVVAMTADAMQGVKEKCFDVGMNGFITKPIDPAELFATLLKWIKAGEREFITVKEEKGSNLSIPELKGVNLEDGLNRVGGNKKLFLKLLKDFAKNKDVLQNARRAFEEKKTEDADRIIHTLKGTSGNLGITKVHELTKTLESHLSDKGWDDFDSLSIELKGELDMVLQELESKLNEQQKDQTKSQNWKLSAEQLEVLLSEDDPSAMDFLNGLVPWDHPEFEELKDLVNSFDFEESLELLKKMINSDK